MNGRPLTGNKAGGVESAFSPIFTTDRCPLPDSRWAWRRTWADGLAGLAAASICVAFMIITEPFLAIAWDEGYTLGRQERLRTWFRAIGDPEAFARSWRPPAEELVPPNRIPAPRRDELSTRAGLFSPPVLAWFWPFARDEPDGHPPVYALVGMAGDLIAPMWEALPRARLGPILVFSLIGGWVFSFFRSRWGTWPAIAVAGAWICQPHLFALAHYATYDGLLTSFWTGCVLSYAQAVEQRGGHGSRMPRWPWVVLFGVLVACAMGTKLTGWLLPFPFLAWAILYRDRRGLLALAVGILIALAVLVVLIPPWWHNPVAGLEQFFQSNLTRAKTTPLKTLFLGKIYQTPTGSLPWYNTIVWTFMVTPVGFLALASVGVVRALARARSDSLGVLFVANWAFLMMLRALPHTPGHDAVRQFLPAFGMLALLAGLGAGSLKSRLGISGQSLIVLAIIEGAASVGLMMPVPLSYYSPLVGGLPGATALGMEPTFYWDALRPEILEWLNTHTSSDQKVMFARYPTSLLYLRHTDRLRAKILPAESGDWAWYVMQNRPGEFRPLQRELIDHGHPATLYSKWGVPLLWVFPYREVDAWEKRVLAPDQSAD
jgi:4-amino-4-deoxy-L-arabinose transferase-like glycosyltransferase